jgi:hypothetical protein
MEAGLTHRHAQDQHPLHTDNLLGLSLYISSLLHWQVAIVGIVDTSGKLATGVIDMVGAP